jgi:hypothetical protein
MIGAYDGGVNMPRSTLGPDLEWERFMYTLPKSGATVEVIREIVMNDEDLEFMELSRAN